MIPVLVSPPTLSVVSLFDLKHHLRVDHDDDDALIASIEATAVAHLDGWRGVLGRCIMPQTWRQDFTGWGELRLAMPDVSSAVVTYQDAAGDMQPAPTATLGIDGRGPYVDADGPETELVRVQYVCALPQELLPVAQSAVKIYATHLYDHADLSPAFGALVNAIRWRLA